MAKTTDRPAVYRCEDRLALTNEADDSFRHIAQRTTNPHIINEVERGRSHLARLWSSLVDERQGYQKGNTDAKDH